jgi:signal transduction histidine kinase
VRAGALHFLKKRQVSEPLFIPLVEAILERKKLESALITAKLKEQKMNTIRLLLATLRHEINNPLGAVLGGAYLIRAGGTLDADQIEAIKLIEASGNRIKDVMKRICEAADLEEVVKANEPIYQIPGDAPWGEKK